MPKKEYSECVFKYLITEWDTQCCLLTLVNNYVNSKHKTVIMKTNIDYLKDMKKCNDDRTVKFTK